VSRRRAGLPRERAFWVLLGTLVLAGLAASFLGERPRRVRLTLVAALPAPRPQPGGRQWHAVRFSQIAFLPAKPGGVFVSPTLLRLGPTGDFYVLDSGASRIARISPDGRLLASYGPADLGNPSDVAIGSSGEVWVSDPDRRRITVFDAAGAVARRIVLDRPAFRLALTGNGGFVTTDPEPSPALFRLYTPAGSPLGAFGAFFPPPLQDAQTTDGWIVATGPASFVYPLRHAGLLAAFTTDGRLLFIRHTIDAVPLPEARIDAGGNVSLDQGDPLATLCGCAAGRELYLLSAATAPGARALDVYDAATGGYRYSLAFPEADSRCAAVSGDRLASASRRGVTVWRRAG